LRLRRALTLRDLSELSGVAYDTIHGIESGKQSPRPSTVRRLAKAFGVAPGAFFGEGAFEEALDRVADEAADAEDDARQEARAIAQEEARQRALSIVQSDPGARFEDVFEAAFEEIFDAVFDEAYAAASKDAMERQGKAAA
jgi:transcriptional regulator with XRE-family HTH domain